jgi:hypothetical protein
MLLNMLAREKYVQLDIMDSKEFFGCFRSRLVSGRLGISVFWPICHSVQISGGGGDVLTAEKSLELTLVPTWLSVIFTLVTT